jgi:hypothetical protein
MSTPDEDAELEARLAALEKEVDAEHEAAQKAYAEAEEELGLGPKARAKRKAAEEAAAQAAEQEAQGEPCVLEEPDEEGARRVHVPCVHCRELNRFRLRKAKQVYKVRCPECRTRYELELGTVTRTKAAKSISAYVGFGVIGLLASAARTVSRFRLRVEIADSSRERDLDFLALSPMVAREFFEKGDVVGMVHRKDELVAVANYSCESWLTTRAGGIEGLIGKEGRDLEEAAAEATAEDDDPGWDD